MAYVTFKPTAQRKFLTYFKRHYVVPVEVVVPDNAKVVEADGVPKVEITDDNPHSPTYGFRFMYDLQDAADMNVGVTFKELTKE